MSSLPTPARPVAVKSKTRKAPQSLLHLAFREERFFLVLSVFIGLFSGLAVVCFRLAIDWTRIGLLGPAPQPHDWRLLGAPTLLGLLVSVLVLHVFPLVRGSGVNQ